ncbi:hypothetical protein NC652_018724 [Populus alba x Populus x berolinensis]|uniref:Uncharacterized protein n=1 Tax=Populus alba x Populus x berolinensis TaxID=444605 RepID=A0AAD6VVL9_9ROSI|nr:hypothetical protein NC652_018724 [Populus alba x Populus x berolinensis]KAJ6990108.1 hypothetical protein NC653_018592 [Populus alba x Populus x berolinensis]
MHIRMIASCFVRDTQLFVFFVFSSPLALKDSKIQAKYLPSSGHYDLGLYKEGGSHCCFLREMRILRALPPPPPPTTSRRGQLHLPQNLAWLLPLKRQPGFVFLF